MPRKPKIATQTEILETLTEIIRSEDSKINEKISASEKLYKLLSDEEDTDKKQYGVVLLPEIKEEE